MSNNTPHTEKLQEIKLPYVGVIVSCYNYESFITSCLESILAQNYPYLTIIVVDDGSKDNSTQVIQTFCKRQGLSNIHLITQENKGQLGSFNTAFQAIKNEEIIFFMDADDMMKPDFIIKCVQMYLANPHIDMAFCNVEYLQNDKYYFKQSPHPNGPLGFSLFRSYFLKDYLGHSTSTISIRTNTLAHFLPLELEQEWKIRADDCIIWGASLVGACIYHLDFYGIIYRIHQSNNHYGKHFDLHYLYKRELNIERLFTHILTKNRIILSVSTLYLEFLSNGNRLKYAKITLLTPFTFVRKCLLLVRILCKIKR